MSRKNSRKARRERLLKAFIKFQHSRIKRSRRYAVRQQQTLQAVDAAPSSSSSSLASVGSVTSELSSDSESVTSSSLSLGLENGDSSGSLTSADIETELLDVQVDHALDDMPDLLAPVCPIVSMCTFVIFCILMIMRVHEHIYRVIIGLLTCLIDF